MAPQRGNPDAKTVSSGTGTTKGIIVDLSPEAWGAVGVAITTLGAIIASSLKSAKALEEVRQLAAPTGNGYADHTTELLETILAEQRELRDELKAHITEHVRAQLNWRK